MRAEFSKAVKREALKRSGGKCEARGKIYGFKPEAWRCYANLSYGVRFEHVNPDANSKDNSLENCEAVCLRCWRWKTDYYDKPLVAKTLRQQDKARGIRAKASRPIPGSKASGWRHKMSGEWEKR